MSSLSNKTFYFKPLLKKEEAFPIRSKEAGVLIPEEYKSLLEWISRFQGGQYPCLLEIDILSFAGDHGIQKSLGKSTFRSGEFLLEAVKADALVQLFGPRQGLGQIQQYWVDLGVDYQFESNLSYWLNHSNKLVNSKVRPRTESFTLYPAMTDMEMASAFHVGRKLIDRAHYHKRDLIVLHSLGDGQLYSVYNLAYALSASNAQFWLDQFGKELFDPKTLLELQKAAKRHPISHDPFTNLCFYGGFEIVALCGAMLRCAEQGLPFLLSDPASIIAWQYAEKIAPGISAYGYAIGSYASILEEGFNAIQEPLGNSLNGESWSPVLLKIFQALSNIEH
ncbi:MAG: nicotinate-nucleotide--dimethylbenzimidazole phosphoribosyltransferase [Bacteroidetes bacterium]|nr:nicotinate-nucleotide--dimethylbenzimidazole phosphoribosyltransferase [Bacteroidota bacterium]